MVRIYIYNTKMITVLLQYSCFIASIVSFTNCMQCAMCVQLQWGYIRNPAATVEYRSRIHTLPCVHSITVAIYQ